MWTSFVLSLLQSKLRKREGLEVGNDLCDMKSCE